MGTDFAVLAAVAVGAAALVAWGAVSTRGRFLLALAALTVAVVGAGGAYYAWMESRQLGWTLGYGATALVGLAVFVRQVTMRFLKDSSLPH
jgi:hypothetical protein